VTLLDVDMSASIPALIAAVAAIATAVMAVFAALFAQLFGRVHHLEGQVRSTTAHSRELWAYCRALIDLYYRHRKDGAPDPGPLPEEP